jgi:trans-feruloyl-CoA hydratase/vanillin synthase
VNWGIIPAGNAPKAAIDAMGYRNTLYYAMTGEPFNGKQAAAMGLVNEAVPLKDLKERTRRLARNLLEKHPAVLRGTKIAVKRIRFMDWDSSADYLYAKLAEALHLGGAINREEAMKAFLDDKKYRPGLETFKKEST